MPLVVVLYFRYFIETSSYRHHVWFKNAANDLQLVVEGIPGIGERWTVIGSQDIMVSTNPTLSLPLGASKWAFFPQFNLFGESIEYEMCGYCDKTCEEIYQGNLCRFFFFATVMVTLRAIKILTENLKNNFVRPKFLIKETFANCF